MVFLKRRSQFIVLGQESALKILPGLPYKNGQILFLIQTNRIASTQGYRITILEQPCLSEPGYTVFSEVP
jgi:hypothetical protein